MQENRNTPFCLPTDCKGTVCIDTKKVLDCCRGKDCYEDNRVYLTALGEDVIANSTNVRIRSAKILWTYVGIEEVAFNKGFYRIPIRFYIEVEAEGCVAVGRAQCFKGLAVLEKDVILFGGEGRTTSFSSSPNNSFCNIGDLNTVTINDPEAIVETVEPVVLGMKVTDCNCPCPSSEQIDFPDCVKCSIDGDLCFNTNKQRLYISIGIFSVVRLVRNAQLLVQATDYSVPDKECSPAANNENPCALFRTMPFPVTEFRGTDFTCEEKNDRGRQNNGGCGCSGQRNG